MPKKKKEYCVKVHFLLKYSSKMSYILVSLCHMDFFYFHELYAIKVEIKTKKGFECFTRCTMNLEYMKVYNFELNYRRK